jgi:hypothetical protein
MRALLATTVILLVAGCASTYVIEPSFSAPLVVGDSLMQGLVQSTNQVSLRRSSEYDPGAEFGVSRSDPLLAPMPFGGSMFGPWETGNGFRPAPPSDPMPDIAGKDIHTVMHYLALRTGLQIIVEGELDLKLTVNFSTTGPLSRDRALEIIQSICKANKLDYIEEGDIVILKKRPAELSLAHVVASELAGHYDVGFEDHELVAAIMEAATVTKTQVFVPAVQVNPDDPPAEEEERAGLPIKAVKISLFMRAATPERILRRLAELGDMELELVTLEDAVDGAGTGYKFKYRE